MVIFLSTIYDIVYSILNRKFQELSHFCGNYVKKIAFFHIIFLGEKSQALLTFSFYNNGMKLISYKELDAFPCINGIRAISTQWIVLGHTFLMYLWLPIQNKSDIRPVNYSIFVILHKIPSNLDIFSKYLFMIRFFSASVLFETSKHVYNRYSCC